ncbi:hypothetical protein F5B20DRAFT_555341 [Whalleya microplaca]|nr:hypothetical protein F5B20DRAFT_555341 [Whalleya microplaca]
MSAAIGQCRCQMRLCAMNALWLSDLLLTITTTVCGKRNTLRIAEMVRMIPGIYAVSTQPSVLLMTCADNCICTYKLTHPRYAV